MNARHLRIFAAAILAIFGLVSTSKAQETAKQDSTTTSKLNGKEESNRNVMLNASSATGPRQVPIGIPGLSMDVTIDQDNLPVSYYFWPDLPTYHWRADASLSHIGLYKLSETGIVNGAVGYAVTSDTQLGGDKLGGTVNYSLNHFGSQQLDMNINGPIAKGWSFSGSLYQYINPGNFKLGYADELEHTQKYKIALTKKLSNGKGDFTFMTQFVKSKDLGSITSYLYAPFIYNGDGSVSKIPGVSFGTTSNVQSNGVIQYMDILTGQTKTASLNDANLNTSYARDYTGLFNYSFDNGMKLKVAAKYQNTLTAIMMQIPLSVTQDITADDGYSYYGTSTAFTGNLETMYSLLDKGKLNNFFLVSELTKTDGNHNWRIGLNQLYTHTNWSGNGSFYAQSVSSQPELLTNSTTGTFYGFNSSSEAYKGYENKLAAYFSDEWNITDRFNLNYGLRLEYQKVNVDNLPYARYTGFYLGDNSTGTTIDWVNTDKNYLNTVWTASAVYKLTNPFGLLAELDYNQQHSHLEAYAGAEVPPSNTIPISIGRAGVYYNNKYFSLVSAVTYIRKNNFYERRYMVNPDDYTDNQTIVAKYDVQTLGWTTDVAATPFKNFNLHFLLTLQDPKYKSFQFTAFDNNYDFSNKSVTGISKILMEIDPSYNITEKVRLWASFRYFGKQYANLSNALYFNGHWETFGGADYTLNKYVSLGLNVVNFLNQNGVSGSITGSDLMTDASKYKDYMMTGSYIRPFTAEMKATIKF